MKYLSLIILLFLTGCKKDNTEFDAIVGEPINLIGTSWLLVQSNEIIKVKQNGRNFPVIDFGSDGFRIQSSCNRMFGKLVLTNSSFTFGSLTTTYALCDEDRRRIEAYFYELVNNEISYKFSKGILYLFNHGKVIGAFKRAE